jgi:hypothetical protein
VLHNIEERGRGHSASLRLATNTLRFHFPSSASDDFLFVWKLGGARKPAGPRKPGARKPGGAREPAGLRMSQDAYFPLFLPVSPLFLMVQWCGIRVIKQNGKFHLSSTIIGVPNLYSKVRNNQGGRRPAGTELANPTLPHFGAFQGS